MESLFFWRLLQVRSKVSKGVCLQVDEAGCFTGWMILFLSVNKE